MNYLTGPLPPIAAVRTLNYRHMHFPTLEPKYRTLPPLSILFLRIPFEQEYSFFLQNMWKEQSILHSGFKQTLSPQQKNPQMKIGLFNLDLSEKRSWSNFEVMFPDLLKYYPFFLSNKTLFCSSFPSNSIEPFCSFISLLTFSIDHWINLFFKYFLFWGKYI